MIGAIPNRPDRKGERHFFQNGAVELDSPVKRKWQKVEPNVPSGFSVLRSLTGPRDGGLHLQLHRSGFIHR